MDGGSAIVSSALLVGKISHSECRLHWPDTVRCSELWKGRVPMGSLVLGVAFFLGQLVNMCKDTWHFSQLGILPLTYSVHMSVQKKYFSIVHCEEISSQTSLYSFCSGLSCPADMFLLSQKTNCKLFKAYFSQAASTLFWANHIWKIVFAKQAGHGRKAWTSTELWADWTAFMAMAQYCSLSA